MSKKKYLIDKKVILDCEKMTLSCDRESLRISESECNLLIAFHEGLFKKDDLIAWVWGRKGVVVSSASYYKLINQLRGSFEKVGLPPSAVLTRPKVGVTLSVSIESLPDASTPAMQNIASDTVAPVADASREPTQISQFTIRKEWFFLIGATLFLLVMIYIYHNSKPDYFSELGTYNGYTFYGVTEDNRTLEDAVGAFSELSPQVYKQNGNFIYYIRVPNTNIFVQCLNQLNVSEPKCITIKERY